MMPGQLAPTPMFPKSVARADSIGASSTARPGKVTNPVGMTGRSVLTPAGTPVPTTGQTWPRGNKQ